MNYNHHCDYAWCVTVYLINCHTPGIVAMMTVEKSLRKPAAKLQWQWSDVCIQLRRLEQW